MWRRRLRPLPPGRQALQFIAKHGDLSLERVNCPPLVRDDLVKLRDLAILMGDSDFQRVDSRGVVCHVRHFSPCDVVTTPKRAGDRQRIYSFSPVAQVMQDVLGMLAERRGR